MEPEGNAEDPWLFENFALPATYPLSEPEFPEAILELAAEDVLLGAEASNFFRYPP